MSELRVVDVPYLILGAGLAGLVLRAALHPGIVAPVIDPSPASWKIGEANVPEMFATPRLAELLPRAAQLPSFARKSGSIFVSDDSIAIYPIVSNAGAAVHVARDELERLMIDSWDVPVTTERALSIDVAAKEVRTATTTYRVSHQILDCSGGAMLVASALGDVRSLWPVHSTWQYYDVNGLDPGAFWAEAERSGKKLLFVDVPNIRILPPELASTFAPHEGTSLTRVSDGVWMWQIPLFGARMVSLGLVSRHGPISEEDLRLAAESAHSACYSLAPRAQDDTVYGAVHRRSGFARRAGTAATMSYVLVGDAFMFVDPIYSVGTSIAVNKALEVASILNDGGFTDRRVAEYVARYEALLEQRTRAFGAWYSDDVRRADPDAARVRQRFPEMTDFQAGITWHYAKVVGATLGLTRRVSAAVAHVEARRARSVGGG